jgi:integrative and conjugative element protein (TIGR02256 family)
MQSKIKDIGFGNSYHRLIIKKNVLKTFIKFISKKANNESGGILLGNVYKNHCEIAKVTTPNKYDSFGPNFFVRSKRGAQPQITKAWKKSSGTEIYIGEWHTHFEVEPTPSLTDKNFVIYSLRKTKMEIDFLFLVIVGLNKTFWVGKQTIEGLIELKEVI